MNAVQTCVEPVRSASRRLVRELGFMRGTIAGTSLAPSAVHALVEIGARGPLRAGELAELLRLEKSTVSRLVRKLVDAGAIKEAPGKPDGRTKTLSLTAKGQRTLAGIHQFANAQVTQALERVTGEERGTIVRGLALYAAALAGEQRARTQVSVKIETGYCVNLLARCIEMQTAFYARAHRFGRAFEATLARGLAEFSGRMDRPRNRFWRATQECRIVGTIAIDGEDLGPGLAHLRWFMVDDQVRGGGVGKKLLSAALDFCDRGGFAATHLWTFRGLEAARHLYETHGFVLAEERPGRQWGKEVMEQRYARARAL